MPKNSSPAYQCTQCGAPSLRWAGRCTRCGEFGTVSEASPAPRVRSAGPSNPAVPVAQLTSDQQPRASTGLVEFDRVLGGGLVAGQVVLLAGEPGVGKSTLLLEVAQRLAGTGQCCLYVSGEESAGQIGVRAARIGADAASLLVAEETELPAVVGHVETHTPALLVIDSIQTLTSPEVDGRPGGVSQVLQVTQSLVRVAKSRGMPLVVIGQSTRENTVAGPRALEHLVDTVLTFEGDRHTSLRLLRAAKNRYGPADEVVCFEQTPQGMREVSDPSALFRGERDRSVPGTCVTVTVEGRRPMLAEVQALVSAGASGAAPRRGVSGLDSARAAMLVAVTDNWSSLVAHGKDIFLATSGGVKLSDPAGDVAVCLALVSAATRRSIPRDVLAIGEVALSGDLRSRPMMAERVAEAARLGYRVVLVPRHRGERLPTPGGVKVVQVGDLRELIEQVWAGANTPIDVRR